MNSRLSQTLVPDEHQLTMAADSRYKTEICVSNIKCYVFDSYLQPLLWGYRNFCILIQSLDCCKVHILVYF